MNILGIGTMIGGIGKVADDLLLSDEERLKIALQQQNAKAEVPAPPPPDPSTVDSAYLCTTQVFSDPEDLSRIWASDNS